MIPILYRADEKDFTTQGLGLLSDVQSAKVTEQRNAQYYLNMEIPVFSRLFKEIKLERLVKVDDHNDENQLFRIKKIDTPSNGLCNIYLEHISRDIEGYTINPEIQFMGPANQALEIWKKNLVEKDKVTVFSDITFNSPSKYWMIDEMENPFYYLGGKQGSILQVYNGEYKFDNLNIKLLKTRGVNTGASITYGRNMNDLTQEESIEELANSIYPFAWKDKEDGNQEDREMIVLDPLYVDGPHIDKYAERRVVFVDFTDKTPKDKVALKKLAEKYVKDNNVGAPKVSMTVSPVLNGQIAKGLELEKFEQVNLCDIVTVKYYKLGIDVQAKVNEVTFDVLSQRFSEYKLGDEKRTLASSLGAIENSVSNVGKELDDLKGFAQQSADGKNTIFYGKDEPKADKVGDTWFKDNPDGSTTIHVWDGQTWKEVKTDYTEEFEQLDKELEEQKSSIDNALDKAEQAIKDAGFAQDGVNQVIDDVTQQANKIDELDQTVISNGHSIEELDGSIKETIAKTEDNSKSIVQIEKGYKGLSTTVTELEKDFDNLELPARNIIRDSLIEKCSKDYIFHNFVTTEEFELDVDYRILIKAEGATSFYVFIDKGLGQNRLGIVPYDEELGLYKLDTKVQAGSSIANKIILYVSDNASAPVKEVCVDWIAIYKNDSKTTQWYPALEDNSKTLAKHWTAIEQNSKEIKTTASTVDKQGSKISQIEQDSQGIKTSVTELQNQTVGIRNYFRGYPLNTPYISKVNNTYYDEYNTIQKHRYVQPIGKDVVYTLSFYADVKSTNAKDLSVFVGTANLRGEFTGAHINIDIPNNIGRHYVKKTFKMNWNVIKPGEGYFGYRFTRSNSPHTSEVHYSDIKLLKSDKDSDWTPAIEDIDKKFSTIEQTVNGIQTTVENKADKSQVTQLAGQLTSVVKNNELPNLIINSSMINRDYSGWDMSSGWYISVVTRGGNGSLAINHEPTNPLSRVINDFLEIRANSVLSFSLEGFTESKDGGEWYAAIAFYDESKNYISEIRVDLDNKNLKEWEIFKKEGIVVPENSRYTRVAVIAVGGIWAYFCKPLLVQNDTIVTYRSSEVSQSQLTQTKDMINLKVSKGDVMSQINIDSKNILFESDKLVLDAKTTVIKGKTWMDGAIIKDATIGTAQIKNASITNAKIGSMDVGKLTSGTIRTGNIKIASTLEITDDNGTLNGHYDYKEEDAVEKRRFVGSWKQGWRDLQFSGITYDLTSSYSSRTSTAFGQDTIKMRALDSNGTRIKQRIDMRVYDKAEIELVKYRSGSDDWLTHTRITPEYVRSGKIATSVIHNLSASDEQPNDFSRYLFIYPSNPNDPGASASAFAIRRNDASGNAVWDVKSDYIANSLGGGAYQVLMSSNNYLKSSKGANSAKTLNASKPLSMARRRSLSPSTYVPNIQGVENLTPSIWKDGNRPSSNTTYRPMSRSANQYHPIGNDYVTGYTVEDLVDAGLTNAVIYDSDTGEPDGINFHGLMPYIFENIKLLKKDNGILRRQISDLREDVESQSKTDSYIGRYQEYDNKYLPATAYGDISLLQNEQVVYKNDESVYQQVAQPLTFKYNLVS